MNFPIIKTSLFIIPCLLFNISFSQAPEVDWEHLYCDGSNIVGFEPIADGGFVVLVSAYYGMECEKNEIGAGGLDYWIFKMDSIGTIQWQNTIGGSGDDRPTSVRPTSDGGYIIAGLSSSPISGDKTEPTQDITYPYSDDIWIVKLDAVGNILWQNTLGGNTTETAAYAEQVTGGYIVGASSNSIISGDKMEGTVGGTGAYDLWIIKLNNSGNILWQNTIGGSNYDYFTSVHAAPDGGYIVTGNSNSEISGDKIEGTIGAEGSTDYWIIKLTNSGNINWQRTIGGSYDDGAIDAIPLTAGGYIIGGFFETYYDVPNFQIVKLFNNGSTEWINTINAGGSIPKCIKNTLDGGYILGGKSNASIDLDKTDPGPPNTYGWDGYDIWVVKTDNMGDVEWDNALGGSNDDAGGFVRETSDGGYLVGGVAGYDDGAWDKSNPDGGAWLVKLKDSICIPEVELCNSLDDNCNGIIDDGVVESIVVSAEGSTSFCSGGEVEMNVDSHTGTSLQWKKNGENIPGATSANYTATTKGIYTCQTTSACTFAISEWIEVDVYKKPNANILAGGPTTFCAGGSVTLSANAGGGQTYQWYKNGIVLPGETNINYIATTTGSYRCQVTKIATGCSKLSNIIVVNVTCKEENEFGIYDQFTIYPNPSNETITITLARSPLITDHSLLIITDLSGKTISEINISSSETEIDISNYPSGIYFINLICGNNSFTEKFIKI